MRLLRFLLPALLALGGCGKERVPPNVVLIVVDTLRADRLGCYGGERPTSPAIDALAARSVQFSRSYSAAPWTIPSVASMLTGAYPSTHGATGFRKNFPVALPTLAETLRDAGYATGAVISHTLIGSAKSFDRGFDRFHEEEARGAAHVSTPGVTSRALELLEEFHERPFFLFVHYFDPHYDFRQHPEYGLEGPGPGRLTGEEDIWALRDLLPDLSDSEIAHLVNLYDEEIRFTDSGIEALVERLAELGVEERTLIVLTSDHGEEFRERGWLGHTTTLYDELTRVPLLCKLPGTPARERVVAEPVSLVALAPTILELVGVDPQGAGYPSVPFTELLAGEGAAGADALMEVNVNAKRKRTHKKALTSGDYKLIRDDRSLELELYDLAEDPAERVNLAPLRPEVVESMEAELDRLLDQASASAVGGEDESISAEMEEALHSLGYVESSTKGE